MKLKTLALGLALALAAVAPATAQRGGASNWELLGETRVGFGADRDVIEIGRDEDYFRGRGYRRLQLVADGGEVRMRYIRLHYLNGHTEDLDFQQNLKPGQSINVELRGERSYLRQIELFYRSKFGISLGGGGIRVNQPTIKVLGENIRGGPPPGPPTRPGGGRGFEEIARERFDRRDDRVEIRVGRREGRFGQIRLRNGSADRIDLTEVRVRFGNGETQTERLSQVLEGGEMTSPIDLQGDQRFVESVTAIMNPRRRPGPAELVLLGTERPGRDIDSPRRDDDRGGPFRPRADWVPLGQQTVGFGVDRDVIRVGQSEDWFRNRAFDRLHFVAENNEIHLMEVRIVYLNGHGETYTLDRLIRAGSDAVIDLRGRRSYLSEIEMTYRARPGFGGRSVVSVYGEALRR